MYSVLAIISSIYLCLPLASQDSGEDIVFRVANGRPAILGQMPYQISLKIQHDLKLYQNFCGGTLVGRDKILSAGHCFVKKPTMMQKICKILKMKSMENVYAVAGTLTTMGTYRQDNEGTEQWRRINAVGLADNNFDFPRNDIAIAFTSAPFVISAYVRAIPMAKKSQDYGTITCLVSGYGLMNAINTSSILLWAEVRLKPMKECSKIHNQDMDKFICTSSEVSDVLQGDSGGPLVCKDTGDPNDLGEGVVVGVVSGAARYASRGGWHTFFTRVASFRSFYRKSKEDVFLEAQKKRTHAANKATMISPFAYVTIFCILLLNSIKV